MYHAFKRFPIMCKGKTFLNRDQQCALSHDAVMTWKRFPHYWPFVKEINWSSISSLHKGPLMWSFRVFIVVMLNNLCSEQSSFRCSEMPWRLYGVICDPNLKHSKIGAMMHQRNNVTVIILAKWKMNLGVDVNLASCSLSERRGRSCFVSCRWSSFDILEICKDTKWNDIVHIVE